MSRANDADDFREITPAGTVTELAGKRGSPARPTARATLLASVPSAWRTFLGRRRTPDVFSASAVAVVEDEAAMRQTRRTPSASSGTTSTLARATKDPTVVTGTPVAEWIAAPVPSVEKQRPGHGSHSLGAQVALELGGAAELKENVAPDSRVECGLRHGGDEQGDAVALQFAP